MWARPAAWFALLAAAVRLTCYGCWAFTERRLHAEATGMAPNRLWTIARQVSTELGLTAYVTLLFAILGLALGPITS